MQLEKQCLGSIALYVFLRRTFWGIVALPAPFLARDKEGHELSAQRYLNFLQFSKTHLCVC